jgi:hypothetical protein
VIYVWIRQTLNWEDEAEFEAQLGAFFRPRVELWNRTFEMPFHRFRHRVAEIARISLSRVDNATVARWDEIPDGALVVPVDDDDWLAPFLGSSLDAELEAGIDGYRWTGSWMEVPLHAGHRLYLTRRRLFPFSWERHFCWSNNYALRKAQGTKPMFYDHVRADHHFLRWKEEGRVKMIARRLSVINRTLASQTTLWVNRPSLSREQLLRKYRRYGRLYRRRLPEQVAWCAPYVAMMAELMEQLSVKRPAATLRS